MPLSEAEEQQVKDAFPTMEPERQAKFRQRYPHLFPAEAQTDPFPLPQELTREKPWYEQAGAYFKTQFYDPVARPFREATEKLEALDPQATTEYGSGKPGLEKIKNIVRDFTPSEEQLRTIGGHALREGLPIAASLLVKMPKPLSAYLLSRSPTYWNMIQEFGPAATRALITAAAGYVGADVSNLFVDQKNPVNPAEHALWTGGGQLVGDVLGKAAGHGGSKIAESFRETPHGQTLRTTLEQEGGQIPFPGLTTGNPFLRSSSTFFEHMPGGKAMRTAREESQRLIDDALQAAQTSEAQAGRVTAATATLEPSIPRRTTLDIDSILRPHLPVTPTTKLDREDWFRPHLPSSRRTALDIEARLRPDFPMGDPSDIRDVPKFIQDTIKEKLGGFKEQVRAVYGGLNTAIEQTPIPWHFGRNRLPLFQVRDVLKMPELTQQGSFFHQTENVIKALENLPDHITLNTAREAQGWLRSAIDEVQEHLAKVASGEIKPSTQSAALQNALQYKVLPALGQSMNQLNEWITPLMVDVRPIQREASRILDTYEKFRLSEASSLRGQASSAATEDPHILFAREMLEQPAYVSMQDAQRIRSKAGEVSRQPGPNIGNTTAETGKKFSDMLKIEMGNTADNLGQYGAGGLKKQLHDADNFYRQGAQTWNSELMTGLTDASLDDILTKIVQSERPNDLKALRATLGNFPWEKTGQMWLARLKERATDPLTGVVNPQTVLDGIKRLTPVAEEELFPRGIDSLRANLQRTAAMQEALTSNNQLRLSELKRLMPAADWQEVADIRKTQLFEPSRDITGTFDPAQIRTKLAPLEASGAAQELWGRGLQPTKDALRKVELLEEALITNDPVRLKAIFADLLPAERQTVRDIRTNKLMGDSSTTTGQVNPTQALKRFNDLETTGMAGELYGSTYLPTKNALQVAQDAEKILTETDPLIMREYLTYITPPVRGDIAGVRLSTLAEKHRDPVTGRIHQENLLKDLHALGPEVEAQLYGTRLLPVKESLRKGAALERSVTETDPEKLLMNRRIVNDPELWRSVQSEKLNPAFRIMSDPMMPEGQMLDGKHLVDYLNTMRRRGELDAVFPDKTMVDHLYHLGQTAQALAQHGGRDVPYAGRHFPMLVRWTEAGAFIYAGFGTGHPLLAGSIYLSLSQLSKAMTNPTLAKWLTTGMRTPINARHAGEVAGALSGALLSEGFAPSTGQATPSQPTE